MFNNVFDSVKVDNEHNNDNRYDNSDTNNQPNSRLDEKRRQELNSLFNDDHLKDDIVIPENKTFDDNSRNDRRKRTAKLEAEYKPVIEKKKSVTLDDLDEILKKL